MTTTNASEQQVLSEYAPRFSLRNDDAAWILTNAFLIFTMQSGFALLETGCVASKNAANIMVKNMVDVTVGGLSYWMFGYGLTFGESWRGLLGTDSWFVVDVHNKLEGTVYAEYLFQLSMATTATTIVSGAVAERIRFDSYVLFSFVNSFIYALPASWIWNKNGFLRKLGFIDFAGCCTVHFVGGTTAIVATWLLGPRLGRFSANVKETDSSHRMPLYNMSSPITALTGTFMLWWAWLGFNCGSSFGVNDGRWQQAALAGVNTINASVGGSLAGLFILKVVLRRHYDIGTMLLSVLAGLVSSNGSCGVTTPALAMLIGAVAEFAAGAMAVTSSRLLLLACVDDPVGVIPVHFVAGVWGTLAVGLFAKDPGFGRLSGGSRLGLIYSGNFDLLGVQALGLLCVFGWTLASSLVVFLLLKHTLGIRVSVEEEILGSDWVEHRVRSENIGAKLEAALQVVLYGGADAHLVHQQHDEVLQRERHIDAVLVGLLSELLKPQQPVDSFVRNLHPQQQQTDIAAMFNLDERCEPSNLVSALNLACAQEGSPSGAFPTDANHVSNGQPCAYRQHSLTNDWLRSRPTGAAPAARHSFAAHLLNDPTGRHLMIHRLLAQAQQSSAAHVSCSEEVV